MVITNVTKTKHKIPYHCKNCGKKYVRKHGMSSRFCTPECSRKHRKKMEKELLGEWIQPTLVVILLHRTDKYTCSYSFNITLFGTYREDIKITWRKKK